MFQKELLGILQSFLEMSCRSIFCYETPNHSVYVEKILDRCSKEFVCSKRSTHSHLKIFHFIRDFISFISTKKQYFESQALKPTINIITILKRCIRKKKNLNKPEKD
jgi:hypothetical protein